MNLTTKLTALDTPIQVGFVGAGIFGSQVIHAVESTPGMETTAIADIELEKARTTFRRVGVDESAIETVASTDQLNAVIDSEGRAVADDGGVVVEADVDVVVDATGNPNVAAHNGFKSLLAGNHFVNVSVEADTVCGGILADIAAHNGVTYTLAYGDQPAQLVELCEWAGASGFDVIAAGKSSRESQHYGTPDDAIERHGYIESFGDGIDPDPYIYNTFQDGTKTAVESVAAANALGLGIDTTGMHKPSVPAEEIPDRFRPESEGGVLSETGVIDSVIPTDVRFSVFVVTRTDSQQLREYYSIRPNVTSTDDGTYHVFYRPYHFAPETTVSIARAALLNEHTGVYRSHEAEVVAAAKKDLDPGEEIDGGGGYTIYGVAEDADRAAEMGCVPFELLEGAEVTASIERDEVVTYDNVDVDTDQFMFHLRELQDA